MTLISLSASLAGIAGCVLGYMIGRAHPASTPIARHVETLDLVLGEQRIEIWADGKQLFLLEADALIYHDPVED